MNRREWLKCMSALAVGAATAPSLLAVFEAHAAAQGPQAGSAFFGPSQSDLIAAVVDVIIPRTDTPGALDAGVPRFIDQMFKDVYTKAEQTRYLAALNTFATTDGASFATLDAAKRRELIARLHGKAIGKDKAVGLTSAPAFVLMTKKLAMLGYFMSEPGCTKVLQYVAVPGGYRADVPLSQAGNGKAWAVETELKI